MYKKILVAVNDNERAFKALAHAHEMSEKMSAKLFVLFVFRHDAGEEHQLDFSLEEQNLREKINSAYPEIVENAKFISKDGKNIATLIVAVAEEDDIDLIVLGSRRLTGANSVIRRSVANAVISSSHKPVLIV